MTVEGVQHSVKASIIAGRGADATNAATTMAVVTKGTFSQLWRTLCECYRRNERSFDRAYYDWNVIDELYGKELSHVLVRRVIVTNKPVRCTEESDGLKRAARNKGIFIAVLSLRHGSKVNRDDDNDDLDHWLNETIFFENIKLPLTTVSVTNSIRGCVDGDNTRDVEIDDDDEPNNDGSSYDDALEMIDERQTAFPTESNEEQNHVTLNEEDNDDDDDEEKEEGVGSGKKEDKIFITKLFLN